MPEGDTTNTVLAPPVSTIDAGALRVPVDVPAYVNLMRTQHARLQALLCAGDKGAGAILALMQKATERVLSEPVLRDSPLSDLDTARLATVQPIINAVAPERMQCIFAVHLAQRILAFDMQSFAAFGEAHTRRTSEIAEIVAAEQVESARMIEQMRLA